MFHRSSVSQAPPGERSEQEMLVLACSLLHVHQSRLSALVGLQVVMHQAAPGCYAYVRFYENGELEVFLPRECPGRVKC